jgi:hypothetical protein
MIENGAPMEPDYNRFDCSHETTSHAHLKDGTWTRVYNEAWRRFYSLGNMKAILSRTHPNRYWDVFYNLFWYKNAIVNEGAHPMSTGVVRLKDRETRRPGFPLESRLQHLRRRIPEICVVLRGTVRVVLEMEELWLATRQPSEAEVCLLEELGPMGSGLRRDVSIPDLQAAYVRAKTRKPSIEVPSRLGLFCQRNMFWRVSCLRRTRRDLAKFWIGVQQQFRRRRFWTLLRIDRLVVNALREICLAGCFLMALLTSGPVGKTSSENRPSAARLDVCPVPPADSAG